MRAFNGEQAAFAQLVQYATGHHGGRLADMHFHQGTGVRWRGDGKTALAVVAQPQVHILAGMEFERLCRGQAQPQPQHAGRQGLAARHAARQFLYFHLTRTAQFARLHLYRATRHGLTSEHFHRPGRQPRRRANEPRWCEGCKARIVHLARQQRHAATAAVAAAAAVRYPQAAALSSLQQRFAGTQNHGFGAGMENDSSGRRRVHTAPMLM